MSSSSTSKIFLCLRWLVLLSVFGVNMQLTHGQQHFCGRQLTDVLNLMCPNGFRRKVRKSIDPNDYYMDDPEDLPSPFEQLPFFSKVPASVVGKTRRRRYGVVDECCKKPCRQSELLSYCRH